ncbi:MAG: hypothetical protein JXR61_08815 [Prolixibacteraceae bacterium]|nr:hypothetical protein [Prolixibacteraceae bacterium]
MKASEIKIKLFKQIDALDNEKLEELYGVFLNFIHGKDNTEEWDKLTDTQKNGIEKGIYEMNSDQGIPNDLVLEELRKKYGVS